MTDDTTLPAVIGTGHSRVSTLDQLAAIPEEEIWLAKQKSAQTRRAYRLDVRHFMRSLDITSTDQLRQVDHRAVIAWERMQSEQEGAKASTVRRRLAALSSLFKHLVKHGAAHRNPVVDVERPRINRDEGSTAAFSKIEARKLLDAPPADTLAGLRDRAILSVGLQAGFRRAEIAALNVGDLHQNRGFDALRVIRKGGGARPWRSIRRPRNASVPISKRPVTAISSTRRCSVPCAATPGRSMQPGAWTRARLTAWCGNTRPRSASLAATRRTRCARPSSRPRLRTARSSRTCRRPPDIAIRRRQSSTTGAVIIQKKPPAFLRRIEGVGRMTTAQAGNIKGEKDKARAQRVKENYAVVGELVLMSTGLDFLLNRVLMAVLDLGTMRRLRIFGQRDKLRADRSKRT
jgi:integrase